ncbi:hypothetical protein JTE90_013243 [Oedothorax gibbosus]|uniref:Uncharacterized protein n=1 Tax=Oedothorax gibbosus TaxID=931172 RepID=A0AAV6VFQ3_9ARAC|nr:hypothetical protein JTE90_013243 [Oedothorax gibbosus]
MPIKRPANYSATMLLVARSHLECCTEEVVEGVPPKKGCGFNFQTSQSCQTQSETGHYSSSIPHPPSGKMDPSIGSHGNREE